MSAATTDLARERTYLLGIAYRMLGSASDAEDVVQEALLRAVGRSDLEVPRAFLTTVVTRLCLDELDSARRRRVSYVGTYLPEPIPTDVCAGDGPGSVEQRENVSLGLLIVLDSLSPLERAVFVLREVFELEFAEIGAALSRSEAACRKLLQRARARVEQAGRSPLPPSATQYELAGNFFGAIARGDLQAVVELLAEQATLETDHGGKVKAARKTLFGDLAVARFLHGLFAKGQRDPEAYRLEPALLNGAPALVLRGASGAVEGAFVLELAQTAERAFVNRVRVMRNPDKLAALERALSQGFRLPVQPNASIEA